MKSLAIIGSTGSIGETSLKVYQKNKTKFNLIYLSAHNNYKKLLKQSKIYKPKNFFLTNGKFIDKISSKKLISLDQVFKKNNKKIDYIISGASGYDALDLNIKLIKITKNLLIANKETIICGGQIFLDLAKKYKCKIIPIDSEHYCINYFLKNFEKNHKVIKKIYITASGGPFYKKKIKYNESVNKVLKHPVWKMGKEITVNSSNFSNKVLEMFEAKILFKLPSSKIDIIVERKSLIHTIIELNNNLFFSIMHNPKMEIAISNSLGVNFDLETKLNKDLIELSFPDKKKFPIINLGLKILKNYKHSGMIIFTVFNQRMVQMFLSKKIKYGDISGNLLKLFNDKKVINHSIKNINSIKDINSIIKFAKNYKL